MTRTQTPGETLPAVRHVVYSALLSLLPPASLSQTTRFVANLSLAGDVLRSTSHSDRDRATNDVLGRFISLAVTPDIADYSRSNGVELTPRAIELILDSRFGDRLSHVAGFYQANNYWRINWPKACALHAYRNRAGFITGFLCQPLERINTYFLLSSSKFDGPRAIQLEPADRLYFDQHKDAAELRQIAAEGQLRRERIAV